MDKSKPVTTLDVRGRKVSVFLEVSQSFRGVAPTTAFTATMDEVEYRADTLERLRTKLIAAKRQAAMVLDVQFSQVEEKRSRPVVYDLVVKGKHARTGNLMLHYTGAWTLDEKGQMIVMPDVPKPEQVAAYNLRNQIRRLSPDECLEALKLKAAQIAADTAWYTFAKNRDADVGARVGAKLKEIEQAAISEDEKERAEQAK